MASKKAIGDFADKWGCLLVFLLFICFVIFLFVMNNRKKEHDKPVLGKYLYIDINETLHALRHCPAIGKQPNGLGSVDRAVTRITPEMVDLHMLDFSCSRCISDRIYEELRNRAIDNDTSLTPPSRRHD